ncbi:MAG: 2-succinyl-5-enolpyruvyl-6-hydroxy-3-cyclohexene-1-carboxylic-acid synthase [Anaerolineae bacterium]|nr:2-succinyl-5-enolpyruvyl-6-hydroxy-3-cyclohexene-1-carboxylic-acid synthase [Anaerolineae bacterium]NUQ02428.1 2-succinyl-5-enolpyruvyl-6-hydroxy-3-cyclohexene-1-carboxylic-acid synthase [Anaerolineae bacterium]
MYSPNRNYLWASTVVDQLARAGLRAVCIAPGSRSTPLTLAFAEHADIEVFRHLDERSAGFFALGLARATDRPVALVCTSGSAVANFFPAVVEAHASRLPLLILTGDRPQELRFSGANQTIDQLKFYGDYARWSVDLALPEGDPTALMLRYLRTTAARAYAIADGLPKGVVHLNFPFRKPLEPENVESDQSASPLPISGDADELRRVHTCVMRGTNAPSSEQISITARLIREYEKAVIVCGTNCPGGDFPRRIAALAAHLQIPLFAEPSSGVRYLEDLHPLILGGYETFLNKMNVPLPDLVIRFGDVPTSKWLNDMLEQSPSHAYLQISADGVWSDDLHRTTHFMHCDPGQFCLSLTEELPARQASEWSRLFVRVEAATWLRLSESMQMSIFDGAFVGDLIAEMSAGAQLFVGSSLPVRHVDQFGRPRAAGLSVYANRGASGIDGNVSTALGIAAADPQRPLVMLVGDVTLYHDMNGLFALQDRDMQNVTIVVINNNGGGIFQRLPISRFEPPFTDLFVMPHDLDFQHVAALYGLEHHVVADRAEFRQLIRRTTASQGARLIEVRTSISEDETTRRRLIQQVRTEVESLLVTQGL